MNDDEELTADHFWDSEGAEQEYYAVGRAGVEAEKKLSEAKSHLLTVQAVYTCFAKTPGAASVIRKTFIYPDGSGYIEEEEKVLDGLNHALNPYWLPEEGGRFEFGYSYGYHHSHAPWQGSLIVQKVESETLQGAVGYGRHKKRDGAYVHLRITYSYDKRVEWYTPTGDVGMSSLEHSLRFAASPFMTPNSLFDKLLEEVKQEVYALIRPLSQKVVLEFYPDLAPTNIEEIRYSSGLYKEDDPELSWPPLARYERPHVGSHYNLSSYKSTCWICCGRWEMHKFPLSQLEAVREQIERIFDRLRERIADAARAVVAVEEEIAALRRRKDNIHILHYKPLIYKEFWSAMQTTGQ